MDDALNQRIAEAIKLARIGFYSYTFDGRILAMDRVAFDFFELDGIYDGPGSVIGKNIETIFIYLGPKGRLRREIKSTGRVSNYEYGIRTLKNSERWGVHNSYVYFDKKAGKEAIQVCFYDITARKLHENERIEESEQRYKTLFDHSPDSIIILDLNDRILECNKATPLLFELRIENVIGQQFAKLGIMDNSHIQRYMDMLKLLFKGDEINAIEMELIMGTGHAKWIEVFPRLMLHRRKPIGIQIISRDITDRKLRELEMRKQLMKYDMEMGRVYLSKERKPRQSIDALKEMMMVGHSGTLISRRSKKDYRESIGYAFNLVRISEMGTGSRVPPKYNAVRKLLADLPGGEVVHIDCIEYLMSRIGPKKTLNLIQDLRDLAVSKNLCVLLTVDPLAVPDPELNLIEKESRPIMPSKSQFGLSAKLVDTLAYINETYIEDASPSYSDIGAHFKLSKPTTRSRIKQLQDLGIVREVQKGRKKLLEVTEKGKNYLAS